MPQGKPSDTTTDLVGAAVDAARQDQLTPEQFVREAWSAWEDSINAERRRDDYSFGKLLEKK